MGRIKGSKNRRKVTSSALVSAPVPVSGGVPVSSQSSASSVEWPRTNKLSTGLILQIAAHLQANKDDLFSRKPTREVLTTEVQVALKDDRITVNNVESILKNLGYRWAGARVKQRGRFRNKLAVVAKASSDFGARISQVVSTLVAHATLDAVTADKCRSMVDDAVTCYTETLNRVAEEFGRGEVSENGQ